MDLLFMLRRVRSEFEIQILKTFRLVRQIKRVSDEQESIFSVSDDRLLLDVELRLHVSDISSEFLTTLSYSITGDKMVVERSYRVEAI